MLNRHLSIALVAIFLTSCSAHQASKQVGAEFTEETLSSKAIIVAGIECRSRFCGDVLMKWRLVDPAKNEVVTEKAIEKKVYPGITNPGFNLYYNGTVFGGGSKMRAVAVLPGTYTLFATNVLTAARTNYKLGSPRISVRAGDIAYAGHFILENEQQGEFLTKWFVTDVARFSNLELAKTFVRGTISPKVSARLKEVAIKVAPFEVRIGNSGSMWYAGYDESTQPPWEQRRKVIESNVGGTFPYKDPITATKFEQDVEACGKKAFGASLQDALGSRSQIAAFSVGLFRNLLVGPGSSVGFSGRSGDFRNCMLHRSYRLIELDSSVRDQLKELPLVKQLERVQEYVRRHPNVS